MQNGGQCQSSSSKCKDKFREVRSESFHGPKTGTKTVVQKSKVKSLYHRVIRYNERSFSSSQECNRRNTCLAVACATLAWSRSTITTPRSLKYEHLIKYMTKSKFRAHLLWDAYNGVGFLANALGKGNELKDI